MSTQPTLQNQRSFSHLNRDVFLDCDDQCLIETHSVNTSERSLTLPAEGEVENKYERRMTSSQTFSKNKF